MSQDWTSNLYTTSTVADTTLSNMELMFATLQSAFSGTIAPANPVPGQFWFNTTANVLKLRNEAGTAWLDVWDLANDRALDAYTVNGIQASTTPTANQLIALDGSGLLPTSVLDGETITRVQLTSGTSATWNVPSGVSSVLVTLQGGGGGGGADNIGPAGGGSGGGGGASGEYIKHVYYTVTPGGTVTYTIGAGGAGGPADGGVGGSTVFGTLTARGGDGGSSSYDSTPAAGGIARDQGVKTGAGYCSGGDGISAAAGEDGWPSLLYAGGSGGASTVTRGGGGGGGSTEYGVGASGGGGGVAGSAGTANTGGGGGGGGYSLSGAGGSGIIEILHFSL